jgi:hypothetical protein
MSVEIRAICFHSYQSPSFQVAESLGFMIGPLFGGFLYEHGGFQAPFLVIGGSVHNVVNGDGSDLLQGLHCF